jgi:hypothetical protein
MPRPSVETFFTKLKYLRASVLLPCRSLHLKQSTNIDNNLILSLQSLSQICKLASNTFLPSHPFAENRTSGRGKKRHTCHWWLRSETWHCQSKSKCVLILFPIKDTIPNERKMVKLIRILAFDLHYSTFVILAKLTF